VERRERGIVLSRRSLGNPSFRFLEIWRVRIDERERKRREGGKEKRLR
jgi:hypothetical protein